MSSRSADFIAPVPVAPGDLSISFDSEPIAVPFELGTASERLQGTLPPAQSKVIAIASGKGGTGKTTFTTNLAIALSRHGAKVLIVDADFGLANDHLLLGLETQGDIGDVLAGRKALRDILLTGPGGIRLLPGGNGSSRLSNLEGYEIATLAREMACLEPEFDIVLVDLAAGISPANLHWLLPAHETIIVTNPEITALIDAYGLLKCLTQENPERASDLQIVLNRVRDEAEAQAALRRLRGVIAKHLSGMNLHALGHIPFDRYLLHSIAIQAPVVISHPRSHVTACLHGIAKKVYVRFKVWEKRQARSATVPSYFSLLERRAHE